MTAALRPLQNVSLEQKIGQMLLVGLPGDSTGEEAFQKLLERRPIGNIILFTRNCQTAPQIARLSKTLQTSIQQYCIWPAFIAIDQEGGSVVRIQDGMTALPGAMAVGAAFAAGAITIEEIEQLGYVCGSELLSLGVNFNLAPVADLNTNPFNPVIGARSYGSNPHVVAALASAFSAGMEQAGLASCGKHFPGHGDTTVDSHLGLPVVNTQRQRLDKVELVPFKALIKRKIDAIMSAHVVFPKIEDQGLPATLSKKFLTDLLRVELGFEGLILTDCLEMKAVHERYDKLALRCIQAGADLLCISHTASLQEQAFDEILAAVRSGEISEERINQSFERICLAKQKLLRHAQTNPVCTVDSADRLALSRKIAGNSISLLSGQQSGWLAAGGTYIDFTSQALTGVEDSQYGYTSLSQALKAAKPELHTLALNLDSGIEQLEACLAGPSGSPVVIGVYTVARYPGQLALAQALAEACRKQSRPFYCMTMRNPSDAILVEKATGPLAGTACAYEYTKLSVEAVCRFLTTVNAPLGKCPVSFT